MLDIREHLESSETKESTALSAKKPCPADAIRPVGEWPAPTELALWANFHDVKIRGGAFVGAKSSSARQSAVTRSVGRFRLPACGG